MAPPIRASPLCVAATMRSPIPTDIRAPSFAPSRRLSRIANYRSNAHYKDLGRRADGIVAYASTHAPSTALPYRRSYSHETGRLPIRNARATLRLAVIRRRTVTGSRRRCEKRENATYSA